MLHALVAALQIVWSGTGASSSNTWREPAVVWRPAAVRRPARPNLVRALENGVPVEAEWSVSPDEGAIFSDDLAPHAYPAAGGTFVTPAEYRGPVTIRAARGSERATMQAYVYDTLAVGCLMNFDDGLRFEDDGNVHAVGNPGESDIFMSGAGVNVKTPWLGCTGPFVSARANNAFELHVPYGGRLVRAASQTFFSYLRAADWRDDFTIVPPLQSGDILLFRTHSGQTVKVLVEPRDAASGPFLLAQPRTEFADYRYYTRHPYRTHALFGPHHE